MIGQTTSEHAFVMGRVRRRRAARRSIQATLTQPRAVTPVDVPPWPTSAANDHACLRISALRLRHARPS
jgi:hypothetical protein